MLRANKTLNTLQNISSKSQRKCGLSVYQVQKQPEQDSLDDISARLKIDVHTEFIGIGNACITSRYDEKLSDSIRVLDARCHECSKSGSE